MMLLGCVNTATITSATDAAGADSPRGDVARSDGPAQDGGVTGEVRPDVTPGVPVCTGASCPTGQSCCYGTGRCYDLATPAACPMPPRTADPRACTSDAQCAATETCDWEEASSRCVGVGTCRPRQALTDCGPSEGVCGCDGQTWPSRCAASLAGVRVSWDTPCGQPPFQIGLVGCGPPGGGECPAGSTCDPASRRCAFDHARTVCGSDAHCPSGSFCCAYTALCVANSDRDLCRMFSTDGVVGCRSSADCVPGSSFRMGTLYCAGGGCGDVGSCTGLDRNCTGELVPVCGCDGRPYSNPCYAGAAGARVAHAGSCP